MIGEEVIVKAVGAIQHESEFAHTLFFSTAKKTVVGKVPSKTVMVAAHTFRTQHQRRVRKFGQRGTTSTCRAAAELGTTQTSICRILKEIHLKPFLPTVLFLEGTFPTTVFFAVEKKSVCVNFDSCCTGLRGWVGGQYFDFRQVRGGEGKGSGLQSQQSGSGCISPTELRQWNPRRADSYR